MNTGLLGFGHLATAIAHLWGSSRRRVAHVLMQAVCVLCFISVAGVASAALPTVQFSTSSSSGSESVTTVTLAVTLSAVSTSTVYVVYAASGGTATGGGVDYTLNGGVLTFAPGTTQQSISLGINNDTLDEPNETVLVTLGNPVNATLGNRKTHTRTITDDDPAPTIGFSPISGSGSESLVSVPINVALSAPSGFTVSVKYTASNGTTSSGDFSLPAGTLSFAPGETSKTINAAVVNDSITESDETFTVTLSNPSNTSLVTATKIFTYTVLDNDPQVFGDVAEPAHVASWYCGIDSTAGGCTKSADNSFKQTGTSSIRIQLPASTGRAIWAGFSALPKYNWDVSPFGFVEFWLHVKPISSTVDLDYEFNVGSLRIGKGPRGNGNYYEYTLVTPSGWAPPASLSNLFAAATRPLSDEWIFYRIPLAGDARWQRAGVGAPSLAEIDYLEITANQQTGKGVDVWVDGLRFTKAGTPPPAPTGTHPVDPEYPNEPTSANPYFDPDAVKSKVLVVSFNPILENVSGAPRLNEYITNSGTPILETPALFAQRFVNTIFEASKDS